MDAKRERIKKAALEIFSSQGYANTTVQQIAERARVGKGTFYIYFATKEELLTDLLIEGLTNMGQHIERKIRTLQGSAAKLRAIVREQLRYFYEHQSLCRLITREVWGHSDQSSSLAQRVRSSYIRMLQEVVEKGIKDGELRSLDPQTVATALYGMVSMVALSMKDLPSDGAIERAEMTLQELLFSGITTSRMVAVEA
ncbi:MAG TPA: TetR/AcrR family transcriptional regulator [Firmicutes bacterium]|nr:TetR/AcrR family transcriptional regulator [Bacillota bacterium]